MIVSTRLGSPVGASYLLHWVGSDCRGMRSPLMSDRQKQQPHQVSMACLLQCMTTCKLPPPPTPPCVSTANLCTFRFSVVHPCL